MRQVTLVAHYRQKPADLSELIAECQRKIADILGKSFRPYNILQIHATIVGLERFVGSARFNSNLVKYRKQQKDMDFEGLLNFIRVVGRFPFQVQIGGFQNRDYSFMSRGQKPYERSFSVQGDKAVLMGWPIRGEPLTTGNPRALDLIQESRIYPTILDEIRQAVQSFNILHGYHVKLTDVDNDFYFRIGLINPPPLNPSLQQKVENTIRQYLSKIKPIIIEVMFSNVYVAAYDNETLPLDSTRVWPICDPEVTSDFIWSLYE